MKKINMKPFREFWQDCFNCIVYSLIDYTQDVPMLYYYNNMYTYIETEETTNKNKKKYKSVTPWTDNLMLLNKITKNKKELHLNKEPETIEFIKKQVDADNVIILAIDLFYWIDEGLHYLRNHIVHFSMVIGYDDETRELIVLETGNDKYAEFRVPYERAMQAFATSDYLAITFEIDDSAEIEMFNKQEVSYYASNVVASIEDKFNREKEILQIEGFDEEELTEVLDIIQTHMFSMQNRANINAYMFENAFKADVVDEVSLHEEFYKLGVKFEKLKGACIMAKCRKGKGLSIENIKKRIFDNLKREQYLWELYINNQEMFEMHEDF